MNNVFSREGIMFEHTRKHLFHSEGPWYASSARLESVLFIGVQAVMVVCIVLVAAQLFATA